MCRRFNSAPSHHFATLPNVFNSKVVVFASNKKPYTHSQCIIGIWAGRVTPCAPQTWRGRAAGRGLPALPRWVPVFIEKGYEPLLRRDRGPSFVGIQFVKQGRKGCQHFVHPPLNTTQRMTGRHGFDAVDQLKKHVRWWKESYLSSREWRWLCSPQYWRGVGLISPSRTGRTLSGREPLLVDHWALERRLKARGLPG